MHTITHLLSRLKRLCAVMSWQLVVLQISPAQTKASFIQHFTPASPSFVPQTQHLCDVFLYEPAYSWGSQCLLLHLRSCCVTASSPRVFYLQDGAIDLLRELKNMKMSLETLQVHSVCGQSMCCVTLHNHLFLFQAGKPMLLFLLAVFAMAYFS